MILFLQLLNEHKEFVDDAQDNENEEKLLRASMSASLRSLEERVSSALLKMFLLVRHVFWGQIRLKPKMLVEITSFIMCKNNFFSTDKKPSQGVVMVLFKSMPTAGGVPNQSPIQVLTTPDNA